MNPLIAALLLSGMQSIVSPSGALLTKRPDLALSAFRALDGLTKSAFFEVRFDPASQKIVYGISPYGGPAFEDRDEWELQDVR